MKFFVGDYTNLGGPGVALCECENDQLRLVTVGDVKLGNPTYVILSKDQKTVFSTASSGLTEASVGAAATFEMQDGVLHMTSVQSTDGTASCHLVLSEDERFLYIANYSSGSLSVFPVENGKLLPRIQLIVHEGTGPNPQRQEMPHVHFVAFHPDDKRLYSVDLGIDAVMIYKADPQTGLLTFDERVDLPAGLGPRHLVFNKDMMYVAHELGDAVTVLRRVGGRWVLEQTLSTLPEGDKAEGTVAAIRLFGDRVYVSNRRQNTIAEFAVGETGNLTFLRVVPVFGEFPRDFVMLSKDRILVANQNSGDIRLLALDENGTHQIGEALPFPGAVCVCPVKE